MNGEHRSLIQQRFKKLVYETLQADFKDHHQFIDLAKVDKLIDNGASLKEIIIRVRENIAVEMLKHNKQLGVPGKPQTP